MRNIFKIDNEEHYGYHVELNGFKIHQQFAPAVAGTIKMTKDQAEALATLVEDRILLNQHPMTTVEEVDNICQLA